MSKYIPDKGDLVVFSFDHQTGYEQKGRRSALVISNKIFNAHTGLAMLCPITNTDRNIPFYIRLPKNNKLTGVIMVDQLKSLDYRARKISFVSKVSADILEETLAILEAIIYQ